MVDYWSNSQGGVPFFNALVRSKPLSLRLRNLSSGDYKHPFIVHVSISLTV